MTNAPQPPEPERGESWTSGRLIFRDTPLRDAVEEINRYGDRRIVLADAAIGALPVSGVFFTGQPAASRAPWPKCTRWRCATVRRARA